jgi:hypothetical protein
MSAATTTRPLIPIRHQGFVLGLLILFIGLSVQHSFKAFGTQSSHRTAFLRWRAEIQKLMGGVEIYRASNFPNPPIMPIMLSPLVFVPPWLGSLCWFYLKVGMALVSIYWVCRLVESKNRPFPTWAKVLMVLLALRPIMGDLSHGNVNLFILFILVAALYAFCQRQEFVAGLLLGLSITCKVTPALFVPYFVWKRAWWTLAGCAVGLILFFLIIPGLFLGMEHNVHLLTGWYEGMVKPFVIDGVVTAEHNNQSLPGLVYRLFTHTPSFITYPDGKPFGAGYSNICDLDPLLVRWLLKGCMALFAGLVVWTCRTPTTGRRRGWRLGAEFSLVVLGMLLFSERTWKHHCVTLIFPFAVISYYLGACRPGRGLRCYLIGTLVTVMLLMSSTSTGLLGGGHEGREALARSYREPELAKLAQVYGTYVWAYLLQGAAMVVLLLQQDAYVPARPAIAEGSVHDETG